MSFNQFKLIINCVLEKYVFLPLFLIAPTEALYYLRIEAMY